MAIMMGQAKTLLDHVSEGPSLVVLVPVYLDGPPRCGPCVVGSAAAGVLPRDKVLVGAIETLGRASAELARHMYAVPPAACTPKGSDGG